MYIGRALDSAYFKGLIDDVRVYRQAISAQEIIDAYLSAPALALPFDEDAGASYFYRHPDDSGYTGKCDSPHCPVSDVPGQKGTAVEFDGQDDYVDMVDWMSETLLKNSSFTVMAWVRGEEFASNGDNAVLGTDEKSTNKGLHLVVRNGRPYMGFYGNDTEAITATTGLMPNIWYHLTWRYDKDKQEQAIFVNGYLNNAETGHEPFQGTGPVHVGQALGGSYFNGRIDELAIYGHALSQYEIRDIFRYQGRWVEERQSHEITIDTDNPTSSLSSYQSGQNNYRANSDSVLGKESGQALQILSHRAWPPNRCDGLEAAGDGHYPWACIWVGNSGLKFLLFVQGFD